ncbi:MAG: hypothetical protein U0Q16_02395 [Bryobacteraceae bacterium]
MMTRKLLLLCALALSVGAQNTPDEVDRTRFYFASGSVTLSGSGSAFTIQLPAKSSSRVYLQSAYIECSADCVLTQERNGSAATTTAVAAVPTNGGGTPAATFYQSSDSTSGSVLVSLNVKANAGISLDMTASAFSRNGGTAQNHTFRVGAMTGTVKVSLRWGER